MESKYRVYKYTSTNIGCDQLADSNKIHHIPKLIIECNKNPIVALVFGKAKTKSSEADPSTLPEQVEAATVHGMEG